MASKTTKKPQPFMRFCKEQQQMIPELRGKPIQDVVAYCGPIWAGMSPTERLPYHNSGREIFSIPSVQKSDESELVGKFDAMGKSLRLEKRLLTTKAYFGAVMEADLMRRVKTEGLAKLLNSRFHILTIQPWFSLRDSRKAVPAEIGLVEFTIKDGLTRRFHELLRCVEIPVGFYSEVLDRSKNIHQIELDSPSLSNNYKAVLDEMMAILKAKPDEFYAGQDIAITSFEDVDLPPELVSAEKHKLLPIFVHDDDMEDVIRSLNYMRDLLKSDIFLPLYDVSMLLSMISENHCGDKFTSSTIEVIESQLRMEAFLFTKGVLCDYHAQASSSNCAGARVTRMALLFENVCDQIFESVRKPSIRSLTFRKTELDHSPENQEDFDIGIRLSDSQHIYNDELERIIAGKSLRTAPASTISFATAPSTVPSK